MSTRSVLRPVVAAVAVGFLLLGSAGPPPVSAQTAVLPDPVPRAECGKGDLPETGLQGEIPQADRDSGRSLDGYRCNMELVGRNDLGGLGMTEGSWQMTWYKHCAYVMTQQNTAFAVIDASNPAKPRLVKVVRDPVGGTHEGIDANARRGILVLPSNAVAPATARLAIYDVKSDCTEPRLVTVFDSGVVLAGGIHSGTLSPDGRTYYATEVLVGPCLTVFDLADLEHPETMGSYGAGIACHDLDVSRDGNRLYVGDFSAALGWVPSFLLPVPTTNSGIALNPTEPQGLLILDSSQFQARKPDPQFVRVGGINSGRSHTQAVVHIGAGTYVVQTAEGACANGGARIIDVTDETNPVLVGELSLEVQVAPSCPQKSQENYNGGFLFMTHYLGFDSSRDSAGGHEPRNVTTAFVTGYNMGLRAFDVSNPAEPREIGYYNPPVPKSSGAVNDSSRTWVRYVPHSGHIWFGSSHSGFNVVRFVNGVGPAPAGAKHRRAWHS